MCGIVGYVGGRETVRILLDSLKRLEYRGYDSAGIGVINGKGLLHEKATGNIAALEAHRPGAIRVSHGTSCATIAPLHAATLPPGAATVRSCGPGRTKPGAWSA